MSDAVSAIVNLAMRSIIDSRRTAVGKYHVARAVETRDGMASEP
jgi:hypothetical protein